MTDTHRTIRTSRRPASHLPVRCFARCRALTVAALLTALLTACHGRYVHQDKRPLTVCVSQSPGEDFMKALAQDAKDSLGIDVEFVYGMCANSSGALHKDFAHNDLPADIVFTTGRVPDDWTAMSCLDLYGRTHLADHLTYATLRTCQTADSRVYQFPLLSRLNGITYNATLLEELGATLPVTFDDMVDLKRRCDRAGVPFAFTDVMYTGNGFSIFFSLVGTQWLTSFEGAQWLDNFLAGTASVEAIAPAADYFREWADAGLFGIIAASNGGSSALHQFRTRRALFCIGLSNVSSGYDGPEIGADGQPTGRTLHDVHASMPWISRDNDCNCFVRMDNLWVMLNRHLDAPSQRNRLHQAAQLVELMLTDKYTQMLTDRGKDVWLGLRDYDIPPDRTYSPSIDAVRQGYVQPFYYERFIQPTVVATGTEVCSYLQRTCCTDEEREHLQVGALYDYHPEASMASILHTLDVSRTDSLSAMLGIIDEPMGPADCARLYALGARCAMQQMLDDEGRLGTDGQPLTVQVAVLPYAPALRDMQPWCVTAVETSHLYAGPLMNGEEYIVVPQLSTSVEGVLMNGATLRRMLADGYDPGPHLRNDQTGISKFDSEHYGPYPYACVMPDGLTLADDTEYLVCAPAQAFPKELFQHLDSLGKVLHQTPEIIENATGTADTEGTTGSPAATPHLSAPVAAGIAAYLRDHRHVSPSQLPW